MSVILLIFISPGLPCPLWAGKPSPYRRRLLILIPIMSIEGRNTHCRISVALQSDLRQCLVLRKKTRLLQVGLQRSKIRQYRCSVSLHPSFYSLAKTQRRHEYFIVIQSLSSAIFASLQEEKNLLNKQALNRSDKDIKVGIFLWQFFDHFVLIFITPGNAHN